VVAGGFPEARLVLVDQLQAVDPLRRLPEVQVRDQHPSRPTVLRLEIFSVELISDPGLAVQQIIHRYVRGVAAEAVHHRVVGGSIDLFEQRVQ
jgi:hypothetical protein